MSKAAAEAFERALKQNEKERYFEWTYENHAVTTTTPMLTTPMYLMSPPLPLSRLLRLKRSRLPPFLWSLPPLTITPPPTITTPLLWPPLPQLSKQFPNP